MALRTGATGAATVAAPAGGGGAGGGAGETPGGGGGGGGGGGPPHTRDVRDTRERVSFRSEAVSQAVEALLQARVLPSALFGSDDGRPGAADAHRHPAPPPPLPGRGHSKYFWLVLDSSEVVENGLARWKHRDAARGVPLCVDIYSEFDDESLQRLVLLESWTITFEKAAALPSSPARGDHQVLYDRIAVFLRGLFLFLRLLPAYQLHRQCVLRSDPRMSYRIRRGDAAAAAPFPSPMREHSFLPIVLPSGRLSFRVAWVPQSFVARLPAREDALSADFVFVGGSSPYSVSGPIPIPSVHTHAGPAPFPAGPSAGSAAAAAAAAAAAGASFSMSPPFAAADALSPPSEVGPVLAYSPSHFFRPAGIARRGGDVSPFQDAPVLLQDTHADTPPWVAAAEEGGVAMPGARAYALPSGAGGASVAAAAGTTTTTTTTTMAPQTDARGTEFFSGLSFSGASASSLDDRIGTGGVPPAGAFIRLCKDAPDLYMFSTEPPLDVAGELHRLRALLATCGKT